MIQRGGWLRRPRWDGRPIAARILRDGTEVEEEFIYIGRDDRRACLPPGHYQVEAELGALRLRGEVEIEADKTHQVMLTQRE